MAIYASVDDVVRLAPHMPITPTSKPNEAQLALMIQDVGRLVEASLTNCGYVIPVTGSVSLEIMRDIVAHGALARYLAARYYGIGQRDLAGAADAQKVFDGMLKRLTDLKDPFELPDAPRNDKWFDKTNSYVESWADLPDPFRSDEEAYGEDTQPRVSVRYDTQKW